LQAEANLFFYEWMFISPAPKYGSAGAIAANHDREQIMVAGTHPFSSSARHPQTTSGICTRGGSIEQMSHFGDSYAA
jgi:hypothetical protein